MSKRRTFTVKGPAAKALLMAQAGEAPENPADCALRVATIVHMYMQMDDAATAVALIKKVADDGLEAAAKVCTASRAPKEVAPTR